MLSIFHKNKNKKKSVPGQNREGWKGQQLPWDGLCRFSTGGPDGGDTSGSHSVPGRLEGRDLPPLPLSAPFPQRAGADGHQIRAVSWLPVPGTLGMQMPESIPVCRWPNSRAAPMGAFEAILDGRFQEPWCAGSQP